MRSLAKAKQVDSSESDLTQAADPKTGILLPHRASQRNKRRFTNLPHGRVGKICGMATKKLEDDLQGSVFSHLV